MKKIYFSLLMLAMLVVSTVAKAQYTVSVTSDPENNYFSGDQAFVPSELATALGLEDEAALQSLIGAGGAVYLKTETDKSNAYTGNTNEFWMNAEGVAQGYGDSGTCWFVGLRYDEAGSDEESGETWDAEVVIYMGQMPNYFKNIYTDSELKATLYIVNGDKEVSFDVTLNVNAASVPSLPAPTTSLSALNIVANYELPLEFTFGKSYEGKTYSATLEGVYDALGVTAEELDDNVADYTYTQVVKVDSVDGEAVYSWDDVLQKPEDAAGGAWFGRYTNFDEATGTETVFGNAPKGWNTTNNTFYTQDITLAEGEFSISSGQFPDVLKIGDSDYANLYIIVGDKAVCVKVYINVVEPEVINPDEMVKVGETTVSVSADIDNNYVTKSFTIDMEAVVAALGCTTDDLEDIYAYAAEGQLSDNHTEGSGGFFFNEEGYISTWGSSSAFYVARTSTSLSDGKYSVGQMAGHYTDITEDKTCTAQLVFQYQANYYVVTLEYTVKAPAEKDEDVEYKLVSTEALSIQLIPNAEDYQDGTVSTLDLDYIESKIGTTDFKLYADQWVDSISAFSWSSNYTCTPAPGFWFNPETHENTEHQVIVSAATWGTNSFGITYADGVITWWQFPGQRSAGDSYEANIYLANEETGDYIKYILYVNYVEEVKPEGEIVGSEDAVVEISDELLDDGGYYNVYIDMTTAFDSLGIEDPALIESCSILAAKSATMFDAVYTEDAILYGYDGYVANEDATDVLIVTVKIDDDGNPYLEISDEAGLFDSPDAQAYIRIGLEYDGKRYLHTIWLIGNTIATGIDAAPATASAPAAIYSVAGAKLNAMQKGLNIVKMQDGSVKKLYVK